MAFLQAEYLPIHWWLETLHLYVVHSIYLWSRYILFMDFLYNEDKEDKEAYYYS